MIPHFWSDIWAVFLASQVMCAWRLSWMWRPWYCLLRRLVGEATFAKRGVLAGIWEVRDDVKFRWNNRSFVWCGLCGRVRTLRMSYCCD